MRMNHAPQAVALDQLATPLPDAYAFESVQHRGDQERTDPSTLEPVDVHIPMSDLMSGLFMAKMHGSLERRYWYPARVVRGVMDHVPHEESSYLPLLLGATRVAVEMYANPKRSDGLHALNEDIERAKLDGAVVYHKGDVLTREAESPMLSRAAAARIAADVGAPALFLANCHGGLIPTIQTALTHERSHPGNRIIPIKFSMHKSKSRWPQMSKEELGLIADASNDMPIIVYDDDACGGDTMRRLVRFLGTNMPKDRQISGYVSFDDRMPDTKRKHGERWERSLARGISVFSSGSY